MKAKMLEILTEIQNGTKSPEIAQNELLDLFDVSKRYLDDKFKANVCLSYRHDFGLMSKDEQDMLMFEAKEWMRAIINNLPYS